LGLGNNEIARILGRSSSTVSSILSSAKRAGFDSYNLVEILSDSELEQELGQNQTISGRESPTLKDIPDWKEIRREYQKKGVTLLLLYEEYRDGVANPLGKTSFYEGYKRYCLKDKATMSFEHKPGDKAFVDFSGLKVPIYDPGGGPVLYCEVFVGVLGYSDLIYADLCQSQGVEDWIDQHIRCLEYFQGVPALIVPDNLKSGVTKACRYEPQINISYQKFAEHYAVGIIPARVRKARDKAKVEKAVQSVQRQILAKLRNRKFYSMAEAREALRELLDLLNHKQFQKVPGSRWELHKEEKQYLKPLPDQAYEMCSFKEATVGFDYHVQVDSKRYSVPYELLQKKVVVRHNSRIVEIFHDNRTVAVHPKIHDPRRKFSTIAEHMPSHHRKYAQWNPGRMIRWAESIGSNVKNFAEDTLNKLAIPEQGFHRLSGIYSLANKYSSENLDRACKAAIGSQLYSCKYVKNWLENNCETVSKEEKNKRIIKHENLRQRQEFQ